jgi:regulator of sigma E protease
MPSIVYSIIYFIIVIGILIFIHELGHFLLAKRLGIGVLTFSLGFGPKIIGKKVGETQYQISALPLGGFVKLIGENPEEKVKEEDMSRSFMAQPIWKRACVLLAGSFFNIFLAVVVFSVINMIVGIPPTSPPPLPAKIGGISPGLPAEKAGLKKGDVVLAIDGKEVSIWEDLAKIIHNSEGRELLIKVRRNNEILEFKMKPQILQGKTPPGEKDIFIIGITAPIEEIPLQKVGPLRAIGKGFIQTWDIIKLIVGGIVKLIVGEISPKTIGGPLMIAQVAGEQGKKGFLDLFLLIAVLGVNLGIINLFPIPVLDGGHLLFLGLEAIMRKPISIKKMEIAQQIGLIIIILLMMFAFYNDLFRIFSPGGFKF